MSLYLNMNQNVRGKPNENYAREFMELFCLGPKGPDGTDNYTQDDVAGLAKAFTGWRLNGTDHAARDYGKITFSPAGVRADGEDVPRPDDPARDPDRRRTPTASGPAAINAGVDMVLAHANHAQFLIRKLWAEFIASPIPQATLDSLSAPTRAQRLPAQAA